MKRATPMLALCLSLLLAACGGGGGGAIAPGAATIATGSVGADQRKRIQASRLQAGDARALELIDNGSTPAGYRSLIDIAGTAYASQMSIEVIASVDDGNGAASRLVRLTTDQTPLLRSKDAPHLSETGTYSFRGEAFSWVTIDNGPLLSGTHARGLENLRLDFRNGTAMIDLRTDTGVKVEIFAENLPFNIESGAFGGAVTIVIEYPAGAYKGSVAGQLLGNVGGAPEFSDGKHGLTVSGIYTATGTSGGKNLTVDGIFYGQDPNALPALP